MTEQLRERLIRCLRGVISKLRYEFDVPESELIEANELLGLLEDTAFDKLQKAAMKAKETGSAKDLTAYMELKI